MKAFDRRDDGRPQPLLSVVCAVRNGARTLPALLASWQRQNRRGAELLLVDACSSDDTWALAEAADSGVDAALSEPDGGIFDAWNKSLTLCRGRYVSFVGSDDVLADGAVALLVEHLAAAAADAAPHLVAGYNVITRGRQPVGLMGGRYCPRRIRSRMMVAHVMAAHRLDWLRTVRGFDASYRSSGDYELLLRERDAIRVDTLPRILTYVEDGGVSRRPLLPHVENFRARTRHGVGHLRSAALFGRAMVYTAMVRAGLK